MRIRIKFTKKGPMRFVGHLDFVRTLQKIFRKSNIPIAFTEGFSPHPIFSIAAPLAVGVTGEGEYLDLELTHDITVEGLLTALNACCPDGLCFTSAVEIDKKEPAAMGIVSASSYVITVKTAPLSKIEPGAGCLQAEDGAPATPLTEDGIGNFINQESIIIKKMTKSGKYKDMDLKPGIFEMRLEGERIFLTLATGSTFNIKPEMVLECLCSHIGAAYNPFDYQVHRTELYYGEAEHIPMSVPTMQ